MDLKKMFEIAGVDTTSGKAKALVEADEVTDALIPLDQFLNNYPPRVFHVHMGTYDIGHQLDEIVHNAQEFLGVVEEFIEMRLSEYEFSEVFITSTGNPQEWALVVEGELDDADDFEDSEDDGVGIIDIGWFESVQQ